MIRKLIFLAFILSSICSASAEIQPGDDSSKLIPELGEPLGKIQVGDKTVYSYPQGVIHVRDGKIVHVSDGFYEKQNQFTRKTAEGESIALDRTDENLVQPPEPEAPPVVAEWLTDYDTALKKAQETGKPVFMLFTGSDWCIWCQRLDQEILSTKPFQEYASANLVLLKLDFPKKTPLDEATMQKNQQLAEKWKIEGYPTVILLNGEGKEYNRTGYLKLTPEEYISHIGSLIVSGEKKSSSQFVNDVRDLMGDDAADLLEKFEFLSTLDSSAVMLSVQLLLGSIMVFYVIRRLVRK